MQVQLLAFKDNAIISKLKGSMLHVTIDQYAVLNTKKIYGLEKFRKNRKYNTIYSH